MGGLRLRCALKGIGFHLPAAVVDNAKLASRYSGWDEGKIYEKTGIRQRHVVTDGEHVSDIAVSAAKRLFAESGARPGDFDALILCSQTPDYAIPGSSCIVHERLGLPERCITFDYNQGCTGFIYGLLIAGSMIHSGQARNALLITAETYSRWCNPKDKSVSTIFGDGAAAAHLSYDAGGPGIGPFVFGTDGRGAGNLIVPQSGSHAMVHNGVTGEYMDDSGNVRTPANLYMNGPELFRFAIGTVPSMVKELLEASGRGMKDIDSFVFHQANSYLLRNIQKALGIPGHKMIYEMEDVGNTVSSSIPIAIKKAFERGAIQEGGRLLLAGFGVGYSWAGTLLTLEPGI